MHAEAAPTTWRDAHSSDGGNRTRDPRLMKPALYHLSYARIRTANSALTRYVTLPVFIFVRCNLAYTRLHDLVTKVSSKPHGALTRPLGSRFTEASVPNSMLVSSYVPSTRV